MVKKTLIRFLSTVFNWYFDFYTGGRNRPVFFGIGETCKELRILENNFNLIRAEVENLLGTENKLRRYHEIDPFQHEISAVENPEKSWKVFMLYMMGEFSPEALKSCPQTCSFLKQIPGIYQCFFSILDPRKNIPAHNGAYRGYLRYHLGLKVPTVNPPYIRIKDQHYTWTETGSVLFDDSWNHQVINNCDLERVILVVDIYRPMPALPAKINYGLTKHLIKRFYAEKVMKKL
jgi:aspartyl/asparaginyl beta-hydroxylase (cupin superfamily)